MAFKTLKEMEERKAFIAGAEGINEVPSASRAEIRLLAIEALSKAEQAEARVIELETRVAELNGKLSVLQEQNSTLLSMLTPKSKIP